MTNTIDFNDFRQRYTALLDDLNIHLIERQNEIWGMGLAALGKLNVFNLGMPGLAKSMAPREFVKRITGFEEEGFFDLQIRRTTLPDEILGPISLKGLENDEFIRTPARRLPEARIFLADEFFKAPSPVLNVVLRAFEEREWDNNGQVFPIPLWFAICPSNECPMDSEFQAIRDRLALSYVSQPIANDDNFVTMLRGAQKRHLLPEPEKFVTVEEIEAAQREVYKVEVPDTILEALTDLRQILDQGEGDAKGIHVSDRRYVKALQVLQVQAWLKGRDEVDSEDIRILEHVLWTDPEDRKRVRSAVMQMVSPIEREATEIMERLIDLTESYKRENRDASTTEERVSRALGAQKDVREIHHQAKELAEEAERKGYDSTALSDVKREVAQFQDKLMEDIGIEDMKDWG